MLATSVACAERRHIETHRGHLIEVRPHERALITPELIRRPTFTSTPPEVETRLRSLAAAGAEALLYQAVGPAIPSRLESFARVARSAL
jgi:5,10-methylenetetrahydromethanopterin reductase